jgi:CheY-like chemotaxis protein
MRDVTARLTTQRELEAAKDRAEAASRAKSAFLANMSHEIRTPLNGVIGMAQVMEAGPLDPDQRERLKVVRRSGETLLAVLNDVLDLSKVEAGRMELDLQAFPLAECVHAAVDAFAVLAAQKDVAFDIDLAAAEGRWLGDPVRLRQVLGNLASNAVKFTAEGRVRVSVRPDPDGGLAFVVSDTGLGMDAETARTVFLPFVQADTSVTRRFGGTGLGLTICAELVRLMGGELRVESTPGAGSTFRFSLPLARAEAGDGAPAGGPAPPPPEVAGGELALRVLAAEDNPVNQLVIRSLLEPLGVELSVASDGAEAVARFKPGAFDLVLMDIQMPGVNGLEAAQRIRALEQAAGAARTPILALSANVMAHQTAEYLAAGMDGWAAKPINLHSLVAEIARVRAEAAPGEG